ncbi:fatty acid CoA ligase family protein [Elusimicrobiota bacterium]
MNKETDTGNFNIAEYLPKMAQEYPDTRAVIFPGARKNGVRSYTHLTFAELNAECDRYAYGMESIGIEMGMKILLMVKPSVEFIALTFALYKMGTVPVLIDPGMGRKRLLECIKSVSPDAVVGISLAHIVRMIFPAYFKNVKHNVVVGNSFSFLGKSLEKISPSTKREYKIAPTTRSSDAAILFTTGSTGPAKGVLYEHGMFDAQVKALKGLYDFKPGELDLPGLPVFALFDVALAMTCVIPDMDPTRPALVDPRNIVEAITDHNVTTSFGSPAIWKRVGDYCLKNNIVFPSLKRILMAGAPVPGQQIEDIKKIIPEGEVFTPYGATESLPVTSISGARILLETFNRSEKGKGTCVGLPAPGVTLKVIKLTDDTVSKWDESLVLPAGGIGEIVVRGESVTKEYYNEKEKTAAAKIYDGSAVWHRIGDVGYLDSEGSLWFCGRKFHRVITEQGILYTIPFEGIFNRHKKVYRSALVGVMENGKNIPVIVIEPEKGYYPRGRKDKEQFKLELFKIASEYEHTKIIRTILFHRNFPVDIRHNAKIFREKLSVWAEAECHRTS